MLAVEKWAQGKNPAIVFLAINQALMARTQCEALQHLKERRLYTHQFPLPDLPSWFALYCSKKPLLAYKRLISHSSDFIDEQIGIYSEMRKLAKTLKNDPKTVFNVPSSQELKTALAMWEDMCANTFAEIKEDILPRLKPLPKCN